MPSTSLKLMNKLYYHNCLGVIQVCKACLTSGYNNLQVAEYFCIWPFQHEGKPEASAAWDREQRCLVEINPLPAISLATSFILCEPSTCQGEACIFPHSELEREAWNDELMKLKKSWCNTFSVFNYFPQLVVPEKPCKSQFRIH